MAISDQQLLKARRLLLAARINNRLEGQIARLARLR